MSIPSALFIQTVGFRYYNQEDTALKLNSLRNGVIKFKFCKFKSTYWSIYDNDRWIETLLCCKCTMPGLKLNLPCAE